jgi:hypothetical protein
VEACDLPLAAHVCDEVALIVYHKNLRPAPNSDQVLVGSGVEKTSAMHGAGENLRLTSGWGVEFDAEYVGDFFDQGDSDIVPWALVWALVCRFQPFRLIFNQSHRQTVWKRIQNVWRCVLDGSCTSIMRVIL